MATLVLFSTAWLVLDGIVIAGVSGVMHPKEADQHGIETASKVPSWTEYFANCEIKVQV